MESSSHHDELWHNFHSIIANITRLMTIYEEYVNSEDDLNQTRKNDLLNLIRLQDADLMDLQEAVRGTTC